MQEAAEAASAAVALVAAAEERRFQRRRRQRTQRTRLDLAVDSEDRRAITEAVADSGKAWLSAACSTTAEAAGEADIDPPSNNNQNNNGCGIGCLIVILLVFALGIFSAALGGSSDSVTKSTVQREALPASAVTETAYYTDEAGWISNKNELTGGMKDFYKRTGVQPYLYILKDFNGSTTPSTTELQQFAEQEYDKLFTDEGHFLLVFCDTGSGSYNCGYAVGSQAKTIMDSEAVSVLADYLDRYYSSDMEDEQFFSTAFQKTGERIMTVTKSQTPTVIIVFVIAAAVVVVVFLLYRWREKARAGKAPPR